MIFISKEELWKKTISLLKNRVNKPEIDAWFETVYIEDFDADEKEIYISVPNRFFGDWLRENYYSQLNESIKSILNLEMTLKFKARPEVENEPTIETEQIVDQISNKPTKDRRTNLNTKYKFNTFVVGSCNQFAHAASMAVADGPAKTYNPLFIYGGVGLGKTHLLNAIGNAILERVENVKILYVTSEHFTNEVINGIRNDKMTEFRNKYRSIDVLLIDDIQFIAGKERTQEEFFHTFNALYEGHKQIVMSSDRFPKDIPGIEERLRSRFGSGLIADTQQPDIETRIAILREKTKIEKIDINDDVTVFLASHIRTNIRELEGALIRLVAFSSLTGEKITIDLTRRILRDTIDERKKTITVEDVMRLVCERMNVKLVDLKSKKRTKNLVYPRQISMYLSRELTNLSFPEIGRYFGGKDHTTVMYAHKQIEKRKEAEVELNRILEELERKARE